MTQLDKQCQSEATTVKRLQTELDLARQESQANQSGVEQALGAQQAKWEHLLRHEQKTSEALKAELNDVMRKVAQTLDQEESKRLKLAAQFDQRGDNLQHLETQLAQQRQKINMLEELVRRQQQARDKDETHFEYHIETQLAARDAALVASRSKIKELEQLLVVSEPTYLHQDAALTQAHARIRDLEAQCLSRAQTDREQPQAPQAAPAEPNIEKSDVELEEVKAELQVAIGCNAAWESHCNVLLDKLAVYADVVERGFQDANRAELIARPSSAVHEHGS